MARYISKKERESADDAAPAEATTATDAPAAPELAEATPASDVAAIPVPELETAGPVEQIAELFANAPDSELPPPSSGTVPPSESEPTDSGEPVRRRRRRRTVKEAPASEEAVKAGPTPDEIESLSRAMGVAFAVVFRVIAAQRGAHWLLEKEEQDGLGHVWGQAFAPYMENAAKWVPLTMAGLTTLGVVIPRIDTERKLAGAAPIMPSPAPISAPMVDAEIQSHAPEIPNV